MLGPFRELLNSVIDEPWASDKYSDDADYTRWGVARVARWVSHDVGLPQYSKQFVKAKVDGQALCKLDATTLKKNMKVSAVGHRLKILDARDRLTNKQAPSPQPADDTDCASCFDESSDLPAVQYILMKKPRSNPASPTNGRKRSDTFICVESCLEVDSLRAIFKQHLQQQMCAENIELWEEIEKYKSEPTLFAAVRIINEFIIPEAPRQANLSRETVQTTIRAVQAILAQHKLHFKSSKEEIGFIPTCPTIFHEVQSSVNILMMTHSFPIFFKSREFQQWSDENGVVIYMRQGEELVSLTPSTDSSPRTPQ